MSGRQYGFLGNRSGFVGQMGLFCAPIDVLTTGEKTPVATPWKKGDIVLDTFLWIGLEETTAATKEIDLGFDGTGAENDPDGLADALSTAAAGVIRPSLVPTATLGALLKELSTGGAVHVPKPCIIAGADAVFTYTLGSAHTELVADAYVRFYRLPVELP